MAQAALMALPPSTSDQFERWWSAYPRKVGKPAARRAWMLARRKVLSADVLLAALARYPFDRTDFPRFVPHPATWLNQERYADDPGPSPTSSDDPWGLREWHARQPPVGPGALFAASGYAVDALAEVLCAAGFAESWRGDLDTLGEWLAAGYRPDSIVDVVQEASSGLAAAPTRLRWFDGSVRHRALRWHTVKMEWVRGGTAGRGP